MFSFYLDPFKLLSHFQQILQSQVTWIQTRFLQNMEPFVEASADFIALYHSYFVGHMFSDKAGKYILNNNISPFFKVYFRNSSLHLALF